MATYRQSESCRGEGYLEQGVSRPKREKGLLAARVSYPRTLAVEAWWYVTVLNGCKT